MVWYRAYRISDSTLQELRDAGLEKGIISSLSALRDGKTYRRKAFERLLDNIGPRVPDKTEKQAIFHYSQLTLFRLESIIKDRSTREWAEALIIALVIALFVRQFFLAPFRIPTGSMIPTIQEGDHIFASVFSYGVRVPFSETRLFTSPVERGDIVIFPYPRDPSQDYIKRVVALAGEQIEVRQDKVYIDGQPLEEPYAFFDKPPGSRVLVAEDFGPVRVPAGHLFVMGDNRYHSSDGRVWGFVDEKTVIGKGLVVYWSHNPASSLFSGYRFGRIATVLQ